MFTALATIYWSSTTTADPRTEECITSAAKYQGINPKVLRSIFDQESGVNASAVSRPNRNGTVDHGAGQINDFWIPKLKKYGITKADLYDGCVSAYVGAWILAQEIARRGNSWRAVGAYNSPDPKKQEEYARKIHARYLKAVNQN